MAATALPPRPILSTDVLMLPAPRPSTSALDGDGIRGLRVRAGWLWVLALGIGCLLLVVQAPSLADAVGALAAVDPAWVLAGTGLVILRFAAAAVSLQAAVTTNVGFRASFVVQLACSFVGRVTPEGVGWVVVTQRYLERLGVARAHALAAIALKIAASGVTRVAIIAVVALLVGATGLVHVEVPAAHPLLLVLVPVTLVGVVIAAVALRRHAATISGHAVAAAAAAVDGLRDIAREPLRLAALLVSTAGLTILSVLVLAVSAVAFGADVLLIEVFVVYLASSAVSALSPTPGNLGAAELAFTAGLVAVGVPPAIALAAVLLYRLLTFWLPVLPGLVAFRYLHARGAI